MDSLRNISPAAVLCHCGVSDALLFTLLAPKVDGTCCCSSVCKARPEARLPELLYCSMHVLGYLGTSDIGLCAATSLLCSVTLRSPGRLFVLHFAHSHYSLAFLSCRSFTSSLRDSTCFDTRLARLFLATQFPTKANTRSACGLSGVRHDNLTNKNNNTLFL